ncbi:MAG: hypothetical protein R3190_12965, partial [Thermoanaerobaculia bacterium]|nr:hypothetical protein [Thermoanaerobaculia bacterium]
MAGACVALLACFPSEPRPAADTDWRHHGGNLASWKYSPLAGIDRDNVADLAVVWRRPGLDPAVAAAFPERAARGLRSTPLKV